MLALEVGRHNEPLPQQTSQWSSGDISLRLDCSIYELDFKMLSSQQLHYLGIEQIVLIWLCCESQGTHILLAYCLNRTVNSSVSILHFVPVWEKAFKSWAWGGAEGGSGRWRAQQKLMIFIHCNSGALPLYSLQVKPCSCIEIVQEAASFSNLVAPPCTQEFSSNNQCRTFLQSQHRITMQHDREQIRTQMTAVLQLKTRILRRWNLYTSCVDSVARNDERNLSVHAVPQSSPTVQSRVKSTE